MIYPLLTFGSVTFCVLFAILFAFIVAGFYAHKESYQDNSVLLTVILTAFLAFLFLFVGNTPGLLSFPTISYVLTGLAWTSRQWYMLIKKNQKIVMESDNREELSSKIVEKVGNKWIPLSLTKTELAIHAVGWPASVAADLRLDWITYPLHKLMEYFRGFFAVEDKVDQ